MICAGADGLDSCQGDSGGPMTCGPGDGIGSAQHGIVSWRIGCADGVHPGVYTEVAAYMSWLSTNCPSCTFTIEP